MAKFGDIVTVEFPQPLGQPGREQFGLRPAILVHDGKASNIPTSIVVPITSNASASRFPKTFPIKKSSLNGLNFDSVVLVFQIRAIDNKRVKAVPTIGKLSDTELMELNKFLKELIPIN